MIRPSGSTIEIKVSLLWYGLSQGWKEQNQQANKPILSRKQSKKAKKA